MRLPYKLPMLFLAWQSHTAVYWSSSLCALSFDAVVSHLLFCLSFQPQQQQQPSRSYPQQPTAPQSGYKRSDMSPTTAMPNTQYSQGQGSWSNPFYRNSGPMSSSRYNPNSQQQLAAAYGSYSSQVSCEPCKIVFSRNVTICDTLVVLYVKKAEIAVKLSK